MDYDVELQEVYRPLLRGVALSCRRNYRSFDFLTPILFGSPDSTTLSRSNTSALQDQIKNHDVDETVEVDPNLVRSDHPVISLIHELGTDSSVEIPHCVSGENGYARHYQIVSYGCSSETFDGPRRRFTGCYSIPTCS